MMVSATVVFLAVHFNLWATEPKVSLNVDSTPIVRDAKWGTSYASVVKKAAPSVVNIYSTHIIHERPMPFFNPFLRQFFGGQLPQDGRAQTLREESLGSGVVVSPDGYILTANHVVSGADEIKVALSDDDQKKFSAKIVGTDPQTDVAVLKIDATGLPAITLGDSDQLEVGDVVLAIGDPFEVGRTVTMGIISGLGRHGYEINGPMDYEDFIQTDAAINPGNSGGALVDTDGRLIGINTWIATSSGGNEGVGFAVPINLARYVMERLISGGKVTRALLGVSPQDITPEIEKGFDLSSQSGALVGGVIPNTPAQKAGIESGDVIVEFDGKTVADAHDLVMLVGNCSPGNKATVKVIRDGEPKTFTVTLAENKLTSGGENNSNTKSENSNLDALDGVTVQDLDSDARAELRIPDNVKGALVTEVDPNSNAADSGLQQNDVIVSINRHPVTNADDAVKLCGQAKSSQLLLKIWRRESGMAGTLWLGVDNIKHDNGDNGDK